MNSKSLSVAVFLLVLMLVAGFWYWNGREARQATAFQRELSQLVSEQPGEDVPTGKVYKIKSSKLGKLASAGEASSIALEGDFLSNVMSSMAQRYQRILSLPPAERDKELDKVIDAQKNVDGKIKEMVTRARRQSTEGVREFREASGDSERVGVVVDGTSSEGERFLGDNSTPETRATMEAYKAAIHERMRERGMNPEDIPITMTLTIEASSE